MKKVNKILATFGMLLLASCGFKVLDNSANNNFSIKEINTSGEGRINYRIKNYINLNTNNNSENYLVINLDTVKEKIIKEKNINNKIIKYQVLLKTSVELIEINKGKKIRFNKMSSGDFLIANIYSTTINNEKKLVDDLSKELSEEILAEITLKLNDF